jgi:hypothetical protein
MRRFTFDAMGSMLLICASCGDTFLAPGGDEASVLVVDIPGTSLRLLIVDDLCSVCASVVLSDVEAVFRDFKPSDKRR